MRFSKKLFVIVLILGILGGIFYFGFEKPRRSGAKDNPLLSLFLEDGESPSINGGRVLSGAKEFIDDKIAAIKEGVKNGVETGVKEQQEEVLSYLKGNTNEAIDAVQEKIIGTEKNEGGITVSPVIKTGEKAYFLLSSPDSSGEVKYEIDWGDSSEENGILTGGNKTVSHSWSKKGEFSVIFKTSTVSELLKVIVTE